jgi:Antitoxin Xre-like helix-turn-helix domain
VAEGEAKTGRQPASAKTENLTAYLPWPSHTVLNSTVSSRPVGSFKSGVDESGRRSPTLWRSRTNPEAPSAVDRASLITPMQPVDTAGARSRSSVPRDLLREREAATILHIPTQTMARRRQDRRLRVDESDRLYRIARGVSSRLSVWFGRQGGDLAAATHPGVEW